MVLKIKGGKERPDILVAAKCRIRKARRDPISRCFSNLFKRLVGIRKTLRIDTSYLLAMTRLLRLLPLYGGASKTR